MYGTILPDTWNPRTRRLEGSTLPRDVAKPKRRLGPKAARADAATRRKERDLAIAKCLQLGLGMAEVRALTGLSAKQVLRRLRAMVAAARAIRQREDDIAAPYSHSASAAG